MWEWAVRTTMQQNNHWMFLSCWRSLKHSLSSIFKKDFVATPVIELVFHSYTLLFNWFCSFFLFNWFFSFFFFVLFTSRIPLAICRSIICFDCAKLVIDALKHSLDFICMLLVFLVFLVFFVFFRLWFPHFPFITTGFAFHLNFLLNFFINI